MKFFFVVFFFLGVPFVASAQVGNTGLQFLKLGVDARAIAMGEASVANGTSVASSFVNPALLSPIASLQITHRNWLEGTNIDFFGANTSVNDFTFALLLNSTTIPDFEIRVRPGEAEGVFNVHYFSAGITSAYAFAKDFSVGIGGKLLYEKFFVDDASGFAFDIGAKKTLNDHVMFGASLNNFGAMSKLRSKETKLPTSMRIGVTYIIPVSELHSVLAITSDVQEVFSEQQLHFHSGFEVTFNNYFSLRGGYLTGYEGRKNYTAGFGINYKNIIFDYAFSPSNFSFEPGHVITVSYGFE
ncbi:MAG: PorV/PorQ family protein [Ignavibacteria bacterium]|nr:PorV/PorQ family protein [Ignavibacteria bacterium]